MKKEEAVRNIRAFNRLYMPSMNLLGNHYLGSEYSVAEARVFFEIYEREGCNAAYIAEVMNLDKSYLSRILKKHEKSGYIRRQPSETDGRSYSLHLTDSGICRVKDFIGKSDAEIGEIIDALSDEDYETLSDALCTVQKLLMKAKNTKKEGESGESHSI